MQDKINFVLKRILDVRRQLKNKINSLIPRPVTRWILFLVLLSVYLVRVLYLQKFFLITYALGIYLLYGFVAFCAPNDDTIPTALEDFEDFDVDDTPVNAINEMEDYKPFDRRLPDYKYWEACVFAVMICMILTFIEFFNLPVYAPVLVIYFLAMCFSVFRNVYRHSKKFGYNPFQFFGNKKKY